MAIVLDENKIEIMLTSFFNGELVDFANGYFQQGNEIPVMPTNEFNEFIQKEIVGGLNYWISKLTDEKLKNNLRINLIAHLYDLDYYRILFQSLPNNTSVINHIKTNVINNINRKENYTVPLEPVKYINENIQSINAIPKVEAIEPDELDRMNKLYEKYNGLNGLKGLLSYNDAFFILTDGRTILDYFEDNIIFNYINETDNIVDDNGVTMDRSNFIMKYVVGYLKEWTNYHLDMKSNNPEFIIPEVPTVMDILEKYASDYYTQVASRSSQGR